MVENMSHSPDQHLPESHSMKTPDDVEVMLDLHRQGWGAKRIARELGISKNTVKRYLRHKGWHPYKQPTRDRLLDGLEDWLMASFFQHGGNAEVVRQELQGEHGIAVSLRTVERAVAPYRQALEAKARATVRFETPPGAQLQIDFGSRKVSIGDQRLTVFLFVATLSFSRRIFVKVFRHERQNAWLAGLEAAFAHFKGVPAEVLVDNARALVSHHNPTTREVRFNDRFRAFADYWGFCPRACAPYRARTKGKDERAVGYVKRNAIAGREFRTMAELEGHLDRWNREIADVRVHGSTGEQPIARFNQSERAALRPITGKVSFLQIREVNRLVHSDACIELDTNRYSVPWRYIGRQVIVQQHPHEIRILLAGVVLATHPVHEGERGRVLTREHLAGIFGATRDEMQAAADSAGAAFVPASLLRPLAEYQALVDGGAA